MPMIIHPCFPLSHVNIISIMLRKKAKKMKVNVRKYANFAGFSIFNNAEYLYSQAIHIIHKKASDFF